MGPVTLSKSVVQFTVGIAYVNVVQGVQMLQCRWKFLISLVETEIITINDGCDSFFTTEDSNNLSNPEPSPYPATPEIHVSNIMVFKLLKKLLPRKHLVQTTSPAVFLRW